MANEHNQQFFPKRQFTIRHQEKEDNGYSGQCLEIPGANSQGIL
jgi:predicted RNase H-like HicB family nuclease